MIITLGMNVIINPYFVIFQKHDVNSLMHEDCKVVEGTTVIFFASYENWFHKQWMQMHQIIHRASQCVHYHGHTS